jgi:hypothetical protein
VERGHGDDSQVAARRQAEETTSNKMTYLGIEEYQDEDFKRPPG